MLDYGILKVVFSIELVILMRIMQEVKLIEKASGDTCHILGNALVSWVCKKQACVALSTPEAEYIAAVSCYAQMLWLKKQLLTMDLILDASLYVVTTQVR